MKISLVYQHTHYNKLHGRILEKRKPAVVSCQTKDANTLNEKPLRDKYLVVCAFEKLSCRTAVMLVRV